jgi:hemolysin activation/secretion protein
VIRTREVSLWLTADYGYTQVRDRFGDGSTSRDEIHAASLSVRGYMPLLGGVLSGGGALTRELDTRGSEPALGGAPSGVYVGRGFNLYNGWINWRGDLIGPFHGKFTLMGQSTTRRLAPIEQISLGGGDYGRAYDPGQRLGDKGRMGSAEIGATLIDRPDGLIRYGEPYVFIDGGKVTPVDAPYIPGSLWSGGFGARLNLLDRLRANLEVAYPLWAPDTVKSPRVTASLTSSF